MRSPFPGMDPYIESCHLWEDFHTKLLSAIEAALSTAVPDRYAVRMGERAWVELVAPEEIGGTRRHAAQGDVSIALADTSTTQPGRGTGATAVLDEPTTDTEPAIEPIEMQAYVEAEFRETFIEIYEVRPHRRLVTTIEVLSPANKRDRAPGWFKYERKRQAHFEGCINLVEIDLLRGGQRMPMLDHWPNSPYYLLVYRGTKDMRCKVWPAYFTRPLPQINVPLAEPDDDVPLVLQGMIESIYQRSRYLYDIDYSQPCRPQLSEAERKWLAARLSPPE